MFSIRCLQNLIKIFAPKLIDLHFSFKAIFIKANFRYENSIELKPGSCRYCYRARSYYDMNKSEEALVDVTKSLELNSNYNRSKELLVKIEDKIKEQ